jgi:hypothetical protein
MTKTEKRKFPLELLKELPEKRFGYYKGITVAHTILQKCYDTVLDIIHEPAGRQLVMVVGPPRAGKTFLLEWLESEIRSEWALQQASDPGRIPIASVEIPGKDTIKSSWTPIYDRALRALEEPLINQKVIYGDVTLRPTVSGKFTYSDRIRGGKLRYALEEAIKNRRPFAIFLDEIHHLLGMAGLSFQDQMDCLKSLANMTNTLLVLYGTYEAMELNDLSDQLTLRTKIDHLRRYTESNEDQADFEGTVHSFQLEMPFRTTPDILKYSDYLYERSLGCVGIIRNWLLQAYRSALKEDSPTLTLKHLKENAPLSAKQALTMLKNIKLKEGEFYEKVGKEDIISKRDDADALAAKKSTKKNNPDEQAEQAVKPRPRGRRGRAFERALERDETGRKERAA